jgi:hypothetical protein
VILLSSPDEDIQASALESLVHVVPNGTIFLIGLTILGKGIQLFQEAHGVEALAKLLSSTRNEYLQVATLSLLYHLLPFGNQTEFFSYGLDSLRREIQIHLDMKMVVNLASHSNTTIKRHAQRIASYIGK